MHTCKAFSLHWTQFLWQQPRPRLPTGGIPFLWHGNKIYTHSTGARLGFLNCLVQLGDYEDIQSIVLTFITDKLSDKEQIR